MNLRPFPLFPIMLIAPLFAISCNSPVPAVGLDGGTGEAGAGCPPGQILCTGTCLEPKTSRSHCGARTDCSGPNAGAACKSGEICSDGKCSLSCQTGLLNCSGTCVDPKTSPVYCGATGDCAGVNAGVACGPGKVCSAGTCALSCQAGLVKCGGVCVEVAMDASGNAIVVWSQSSGSFSDIYARRYSASAASWGTSTIISNGTALFSDPRVAMNASGNAVAIWRHLVTLFGLSARVYSASGASWGPPFALDLKAVYAPRVAMDASGNATVVWSGLGSYYNDIFASRYSASTGWGPSTVVDIGIDSAYWP